MANSYNKPRSTAEKLIYGTGKAALVAGTIVATYGIATDRIEFGQEQGTGYTNSDANVKTLHWFSKLGRVIYISNQPFEESDKVDREGFPLVKTEVLNKYQPNVRLTEAEAVGVAEKIKSLGFVCPGDASTVPYNPVIATTTETTTTIPQLDLRVCIDFGKTSAIGSSIVVPLGLEPRNGIPTVELRYRSRTERCAEMINKYAFDANEAVVSSATSFGINASTGNYLPILVTANAHAPDPCDMDRAIVVKQR